MDHLDKLDIHKFIEPIKMHTRVLRELAKTAVRPLNSAYGILSRKLTDKITACRLRKY